MQPSAVLQEAWDLYKAHWRHVLPIALVVYVLLSLVGLVLVSIFGVFGAIATALIALVGYFWLQGALVEAVSDIRDGRADLSIGQTLLRVQPRILAIAGAGILAGIGIAIGLVLLIIPGLVLLTWWSVVLPVIVLERASIFESFGRSRELVRGNGWNVFILIVVTVLLAALANIVIGLVLVWLPDNIGTYVTDVVANTLTAPFIALAWTLMYYHLRARRTADEPQSVAEPA
jgi:hypothetical protein